MTEADFQTKFTRWAKYKLHASCVWELKYCRGKSLPFSALQPHQKDALNLAATTCIHYKIPDVGMSPKPFDGVTVCRVPAFVVVKFKEDDAKAFYLIPIEEWLHNEKTSTKRSFTLHDVKQISQHGFFG